MIMTNIETNLSDLFLNWPLIVFVLGLNIIGKAIKVSKIDNKYIPAFLALVGGASCHFVVKDLPIWNQFNTVTHIWFGVFIGYGAVGIHQQIAKIELIKKIPFLSNLFSNED